MSLEIHKSTKAKIRVRFMVNGQVVEGALPLFKSTNLPLSEEIFDGMGDQRQIQRKLAEQRTRHKGKSIQS